MPGMCNIILQYPGYDNQKNQKNGEEMLLTPIALLHTPHLDSHKHSCTDGNAHTKAPISTTPFYSRNHDS